MQIYPKSRHTYKDSVISMAYTTEKDYLLIEGPNPGFTGCFEQEGCTLAPLSHENAVVLRSLFDFTKAKSVLTSKRSVGVGDRLGIATDGHIKVFEKYDALPILAQQSIRELTLTNRTFEDVLDCASFNVFKQDFTKGFGADGDHLKTDKEVKYALDCGYTMITLDCSEYIRNNVSDMSDNEVYEAYPINMTIENLYFDKHFDVEGHDIHFSEIGFRRTSMIYLEAIDFAEHIWKTFIKDSGVDFEISIDETLTPTTPEQHFFVASELKRRGVKVATVAPRFCGEFQKGIDYIGDLKQFEQEMVVHAAIARHFGYKLSIHSGSDKFSVFPIIGRLTRGNFHVKTAGTNWLEAMTVVAMVDPALYREVHSYALSVFDQATAYYHVTTNLSNIPCLCSLKDSELPDLFKNNDSRQLIHITYGLILTAKKEDGSFLFRDRLYKCWRENAAIYEQRLVNHIGKHLELLYSEVK